MASHWLKNLREKPINKRSDRNRVSPLYSHLKTVPDIMGVHHHYLLCTIRIDCVVIGRKNSFGIGCSTVTWKPRNHGCVSVINADSWSSVSSLIIFQASKRTWWTQITVLGLFPLVRIVTGWPDRKHMSAVLPHWEICLLIKLVRVARCSSQFGGTEVIEEIRPDNWFTPSIRSSHFLCVSSYNAFLPARRQRSIVLRHKNMDARVTSTARRYNQLRFYVGYLWQTTTSFWITSKSHFFFQLLYSVTRSRATTKHWSHLYIVVWQR